MLVKKFCKKCEKNTDHQKINAVEICLECEHSNIQEILNKYNKPKRVRNIVMTVLLCIGLFSLGIIFLYFNEHPPIVMGP